MAKKQPPLTFESMMQRLNDITAELERTDLPLESNVALYKEGRELAKACRALLEKARHEIFLSSEEGDVPFAQTPFAKEGAGVFGSGFANGDDAEDDDAEDGYNGDAEEAL